LRVLSKEKLEEMGKPELIRRILVHQQLFFKAEAIMQKSEYEMIGILEYLHDVRTKGKVDVYKLRIRLQKKRGQINMLNHTLKMYKDQMDALLKSPQDYTPNIEEDEK